MQLMNGDGDEEVIVVAVQVPKRPDKTVTDALAYLDLVKDCFRENPAVYQSFLDTMGDFKRNRITALEVCHRVTSLLGSHPHLIVGFNNFLPDSYHLQVHNDGAASVLTTL